MLINNKAGLLGLKEHIPFLSEEEIISRKDEIVQKIKEIEEYLSNEPNAAAIAAPQLGIKLPIISMKGPKDGLTTMINPNVIDLDKNDIYYSQEGCMSLGFFGKDGNVGLNAFVIRSKNISVDYMHINHKGVVKKANTMHAVDKTLPTGEIVSRMASVVQHELNHLYGILLLDAAVPLDLIIKDDERFKDFIKIYRVFFKKESDLLDLKVDYLVEGDTKTLYYDRDKADLRPNEAGDDVEKNLVAFFKENIEEENETN